MMAHVRHLRLSDRPPLANIGGHSPAEGGGTHSSVRWDLQPLTAVTLDSECHGCQRVLFLYYKAAER